MEGATSVCLHLYGLCQVLDTETVPFNGVAKRCQQKNNGDTHSASLRAGSRNAWPRGYSPVKHSAGAQGLSLTMSLSHIMLF